MINRFEVTETNKMIENYNLDVRTITLGISLLDCISDDLETLNNNIYNKIKRLAGNLVQTGEDISKEYGIPIVNKRISVTPIALIGGSACKKSEDFVTIAKTLDKVAKEVGVNFLGGYSALVNKGMTPAEENLIRSIPEALAVTERVCSSVNVGSSKTGINMDAVRLMGEIVHKTAEKTANQDSLGCAKLVVFCNAPEDNPFMAGAFHGVGESDCVINVGVSGPGVVRSTISKYPDASINELADIIKRVKKEIEMGRINFEQSMRRLLSDDRKFALQTITGLLLLRRSDILYFQYLNEHRCWQMMLTDYSVHRLRLNMTAKEILSISISFLQVSQDIILNVDYLLSIENKTLRCMLYPPFTEIDIKASKRYYSKIKETLEII